jgi:hypothetical protein
MKMNLNRVEHYWTTAIVIFIFFPLTCWSDEEPIKLQSNIIGDKEQPLVSYFIPWDEIGTPDNLLWNIDSKYDKTLELVDRKNLIRSSAMYNEMKLESNLENLTDIKEVQ